MGYAFPPFALIGKCLQKVHQEGCMHTGHRGTNMGHTAMVPSDTGVTGRVPNSSSNTPESVANPFNRPHPLLVNNQLQLSAWKVSGKVTLQRASDLILERMPCTSYSTWPTQTGVLQES